MQTSAKPDLSRGVAIDTLPDGAMVAGIVGEDEVVLIRRGDRLHAVGALCTHYHGPLSEGLLVRETLGASAPTAEGAPRRMPRSVVIVGGGAAGLAAADTLRREGYSGSLTL